jgi:predicted phosphoribosyltransferase
MKRFLNRESAGKELADRLIKFSKEPCVVLAIPRGGVPVGYAIARQLNAPLGLIWVKKIGHPLSPELAIGAVSPDDSFIAYKSAASDLYIQSEIKKIRERFIEIKKNIQDPTEKMDLKNKTIIVVDDGIATGHTILAAIQLLRRKLPAKIIIAIPVAPDDAIDKLRGAADEVIITYQPEYFTGISSFYTDFTQLKDEEVAEYLRRMQKPDNPRVYSIL